MTISSGHQTDMALLQRLLDRAMRPGDPVTLDAWTCAAEDVFRIRPVLESPPSAEPPPTEA